MVSELISAIDPARDETWRGKLFLTVDVDWVGDDILAHTLRLIEERALKCTFFATHDSEVLRRIRVNPAYEVGIHPNYNDLFAGDPVREPNASSFESLRELFPAATSIRSHSLLQSSRLQNDFWRHGFTHDSNHYIPFDAGLKLKPWKIWNGLIKVPFAWADDIHLYQQAAPLNAKRLKSMCLCVVAFHPIHLYLNSDCVDTYERYKNATACGQPVGDTVNRRRRGIAGEFAEMMDVLL
jgi:polysaccharide deactylase WbmS-like protein